MVGWQTSYQLAAGADNEPLPILFAFRDHFLCRGAGPGNIFGRLAYL
jgi:hypothetical protein